MANVCAVRSLDASINESSPWLPHEAEMQTYEMSVKLFVAQKGAKQDKVVWICRHCGCLYMEE